MFSFLVTILYVSIRSPLSRLVSSVINSKILSLPSYDFFLKIPTSFVVFLCTRSRHYISSDTATRPVCSILDAVVYRHENLKEDRRILSAAKM